MGFKFLAWTAYVLLHRDENTAFLEWITCFFVEINGLLAFLFSCSSLDSYSLNGFEEGFQVPRRDRVCPPSSR